MKIKSLVEPYLCIKCADSIQANFSSSDNGGETVKRRNSSHKLSGMFNVFFKVQPGFSPQCLKCVKMSFSIAKQKEKKTCVDKLTVVSLLSYLCLP